jgi:hypothetical protein
MATEVNGMSLEGVPRGPDSPKREERQARGTCSNCEFSSMGIGGAAKVATLSCRRNPPTLVGAQLIVDNGKGPEAIWQTATGFPTVNATEWCGHWLGTPQRRDRFPVANESVIATS